MAFEIIRADFESTGTRIPQQVLEPIGFRPA